MSKITYFLLLSLAVNIVNAQQSSWKKIDSKNIALKSPLTVQKITPKHFDLYSLNLDSFKQELLRVSNESLTKISIPNTNGLSEFYIEEAVSFTQPLAEKYKHIKSYTLKGIEDNTATGKISIGTDGVHVIIFSGKHKTFYIDPYTKDNRTYKAFSRGDLTSKSSEYRCLVEDKVKEKKKKQLLNRSKTTPNDGLLRTYRLALACTVQYANYHINRQGVTDDSMAEQQAAVLSAMNTTMTRVNGIFERDLGVRMTIVLNANGENELIFIDSDNYTDPIEDESVDFDLILDNQEVCDTIIGSDNYDIGHLFSTGNSGIAIRSSICSTSKAQGLTGIDSPIGDGFDVDFVAHEIGHQFGANHTQNSDCNRVSGQAVEPGSGSTIMSYAGVCGVDGDYSTNIQSKVDDYFHASSIAEIWDLTLQWTEARECGTPIDMGNLAPTVNAGNDYTVPVSTPLVLRGEANDPDSSGLTYCWEQQDSEYVIMPPEPTSIAGPAFRSYPPTAESDRYLPALETVLTGATVNEWEVIPSVAREMNFSLTVRDNHSEGGSNTRDDMMITFVDMDPFTVTAPSGTTEWTVGSEQTITWDKSATDQAPINCSHVRLKLSLDGGLTFPHTLVESTPNDGSHTIIVDDYLSNTSRVLVEAIDNMFFNINPNNFSIVGGTGTASVTSFNLSNLSLYPNPSTGVFNLEFKADNTDVYITLVDIRGRIIEEKYLSATSTMVKEQLSFNTVTPGLYLLKVQNGKGQVTRKVVIK